MSDWSELRCDDAEEGAEVALLAIMTGLSEDHWSAGWTANNEGALWAMVFEDASPKMGMGEVTYRQIQIMRLLSDECGGWWAWVDDGPRFLRRADWLKLRDDRMSRAA